MPTTAPGRTFQFFLGFVFLVFIGILVFAYEAAKTANPVLLDEHGGVRGGAPSAPHHP